jgi:hypothetical protein
MLGLVIGSQHLLGTNGSSWGDVLSTFVASVLVLDSAVHLHPDDAAIGVDVDGA